MSGSDVRIASSGCCPCSGSNSSHSTGFGDSSTPSRKAASKTSSTRSANTKVQLVRGSRQGSRPGPASLRLGRMTVLMPDPCRCQDLLLDAPDRQYLAAQRDLARHGHVGPHRSGLSAAIPGPWRSSRPPMVRLWVPHPPGRVCAGRFWAKISSSISRSAALERT